MTTVGRLMYDRSISAKLWYVCNHVNEERCLNTILNQNRTNIDIAKVKQHQITNRIVKTFNLTIFPCMTKGYFCMLSLYFSLNLDFVFFFMFLIVF